MCAFQGTKKEDITQPLITDIGFRLGEMMQKVQTALYFLKQNIYIRVHRGSQ